MRGGCGWMGMAAFRILLVVEGVQKNVGFGYHEIMQKMVDVLSKTLIFRVLKPWILDRFFKYLVNVLSFFTTFG